MSGVTCQVSCVTDKVVELVVGGSVINRAYPVYLLGNIRTQLLNHLKKTMFVE